MSKMFCGAMLVASLFITACGGDSSPAPAGSGKPAATAAAGTGAGTATAAAAVTGKMVEVDLSPAGDDFKGLFIQGPGAPRLAKKPGDPSVYFERVDGDPKAPVFTVTISHDKLDTKGMKEWVTDWAKGFSPPGKLTYVTDKPEELEYSVERQGEDGKPEMAHGYGVEVKVGAETYSCSAPNVSTQDLPALKQVCRSLAKK